MFDWQRLPGSVSAGWICERWRDLPVLLGPTLSRRKSLPCRYSWNSQSVGCINPIRHD